MDNQAPIGLEALCRHALSLICMRLGPESRLPRNGARPGQFLLLLSRPRPFRGLTRATHRRLAGLYAHGTQRAALCRTQWEKRKLHSLEKNMFL